MTTDSDHTETGTSAESDAGSAEVIQRLEELLHRFDRLDDRLDHFSLEQVDLSTQGEISIADVEELRLLRSELEEAWRSNEDLRHDNETLTAQLARASASQTIQSKIGVDESLSWEDRKAMIMAQMETDSFDADSFINSLSDRTKACARSHSSDEPENPDEFGTEPTPLEFVESLSRRVSEMEEIIRRRDQEIRDLKNLLENQSSTWQSETRNSGIAIGAAAIAGLIDADPLVIEERARLQQLKDDWEDKFRQTEIEASLERAKLSRERQELAKRTQELEERLEELQREKKNDGRVPPKGRRWLAELGLTPNSLSEAT
ncbi:hypothetical protein [Neorhodopirellula pilleata]|uniref:hypothetical protein n=1 Tax=Neorhodopirellula pilleata TaxID=2714738 RepID=UPI0011B7D60C|nr:hypothetical protein [Neorhodopirellula pilleata]